MLMASPKIPTDPLARSYWRLMLAGLLAGLLSAAVVTFAMLVAWFGWSAYSFFSNWMTSDANGGTAMPSLDLSLLISSYGISLHREVISEILWYIPPGVILFPWVARKIGAAEGRSDALQARLMTAGAITWFAYSWLSSWFLGHLAYLGALLGSGEMIFLGVMGHPYDLVDLTGGLVTAAVSGVLFGAVYDLILALSAL